MRAGCVSRHLIMVELRFENQKQIRSIRFVSWGWLEREDTHLMLNVACDYAGACGARTVATLARRYVVRRRRLDIEGPVIGIRAMAIIGPVDFRESSDIRSSGGSANL